jgi:outer membrane protein assembly factor BamB
MRRIALIVTGLLALAGCGGGGGWKATCSATKPCEAGNYCAETPDGNVCWPDEVAPVIASVDATCGGSGTCRRDGTLSIAVVVTDDAAMGTVQAELSLDPGHPRVLQHVSGDLYALDISLVELRFPHFSQDVNVTVTARDEAGNAAEGEGNVAVTRSAWTRQLASVPLWSPAVTSDGEVLVAASNGQLHFVDKSGAASTSTNVTSSLLNGPAAVGTAAIWVGSEDGRLYPISFTGTVGTSCNAGAALLGAPAIMGPRAISATKSNFVAVADASGVCVPGSVANPAQLVVDSGRVIVPSGGRLRSFSVAGNGALVEDWAVAPDVGEVIAPPAIDEQGSIWTNAVGLVVRTDSAGSAQPVTFSPALPTSSGGGIILRDGSFVVTAGSSEVLRRSGTGWATSSPLTGRPAIPLALDGAEPTILVATSSGWLHALRQADGTEVWSGRITVGNQVLEPPNIWTEPGATTSTAYLSGGDGYLYAVIVDGRLDTSAPWPKAYHDPQNTSNAGVAP